MSNYKRIKKPVYIWYNPSSPLKYKILSQAKPGDLYIKETTEYPIETIVMPKETTAAIVEILQDGWATVAISGIGYFIKKDLLKNDEYFEKIDPDPAK